MHGLPRSKEQMGAWSRFSPWRNRLGRSECTQGLMPASRWRSQSRFSPSNKLDAAVMDGPFRAEAAQQTELYKLQKQARLGAEPVSNQRSSEPEFETPPFESG